MTRKPLKTTTALCLALSIAQPIPTIAWAQEASAKCDQGQDCQPPGQKGKAEHQKQDKKAGQGHGSAQEPGRAEPQKQQHQPQNAQRTEPQKPGNDQPGNDQPRKAQPSGRDQQTHAGAPQKAPSHQDQSSQHDKSAQPQPQPQPMPKPEPGNGAGDKAQTQQHAQPQHADQAKDKTQTTEKDQAKPQAQAKHADQPKPKDDTRSREQKAAPQTHLQEDRAQSKPAPDTAPQTSPKPAPKPAPKPEHAQKAPETAPQSSPRPKLNAKSETGARAQPQDQPQTRDAQTRDAQTRDAKAPRDQQQAPSDQADNRPPRPAFGSWHRDGDARPEAARAPEAQFQKDKKTREVKIDQQDVFDHSRNEYRDNHKQDGMTDLQKFGLVALGAVAAGAVLSNGDHVVDNTGDRVVVRSDSGRYQVYHDDDTLLRRPGARYYTQDYNDGTVLSKVIYKDGTTVYTVRDADGRVLRRTVDRPDRKPVVLFDDAAPKAAPAPQMSTLPRQSPVDLVYTADTRPGMLRETMLSQPKDADGRHFSLDQIRGITRVRYLAPEIDVKPLTFPTGSSAISNQEAAHLSTLGKVMSQMVAQDPTQVFLVEGHSDAVGNRANNLALSDARAEAAAQVLVQEYGVPPENLITQGYGESDLKVQTQGASAVNRRIIVRPIGKLLPPAQVAQN